MKTFLRLVSAFLVTILFLVESAAQIDIVQAAGPLEKTEIKKLVSDYGSLLQILGDTGKVLQNKIATGKFIRERLSGANIFVYDDIDSTSKAENVLSFLKYSQKFGDTAQGHLSIKIDTARIYFEKIKYDKVRRYYFVEAKTAKTFQWTKFVPRLKIDSIAASDSVPKLDTIISRYSQKINFFIRFDKEGTVFKNFKLAAISKTGTPARLEPLPPLTTWWLSLDEEWKNFFRKKSKLEEYPREFDLEKLTNQYEMDISNSAVTSLEPLVKFYNLEKLNCMNTKVSSIIPLLSMSRLKVLNISRTKVDTLAGIERLKSLEELRCVGNKLEGIIEVRSLPNLIEFDCSENDLSDITPVKELITLKELSFSLNIKIKNIDAIKELVNLEWLAIGKIDIKNLESVRNLVNLVHLDLFNTNISSLEPIRNLQKIIYLNLDHDKMNTLDAIKNYKFVTELYLSSSSIRDLSEIRNFNYLRVLDISNTLIQDLGPVHKFEDMKVLKAQFTKIGKDEIQRFKKNHPGCQLTYY